MPSFDPVTITLSDVIANASTALEYSADGLAAPDEVQRLRYRVENKRERERESEREDERE